MLTGARSARARTSAATCGHTAAGKSCPTPGSSASRAPMPQVAENVGPGWDSALGKLDAAVA